MCQKTKCITCNKWTWKGCGKHISEALKGIPQNELCVCKTK